MDSRNFLERIISVLDAMKRFFVSLFPFCHPLLFAIHPVLSLWGSYANSIEISQIIRPLVLSPLVAMFLLFLINLVVRDWFKASLICSLAIILFFAEEPLIRTIISILELGGLGRRRILLPALAVTYGLWVWWVVFRAKSLKRLTNIFVIMSIAVLTLSGISIVLNLFENTSTNIYAEDFKNVKLDKQGRLPNIYYIVVDSYARSDALLDLGYDNSQFIQFLKSRHFYVAENSTSNYSSTNWSIDSTFNMQYLNPQSHGRSSVFLQMISTSQIYHLLKELGYEFIIFDSPSIEKLGESDTDLFLSGQGSWINLRLNLFEKKLLNNVILPGGIVYPGVIRNSVLYTLENLARPVKMDGKYFVFAHIYCPHPPYVFGPDGKKVADSSPVQISEQIKGYTEQVQYLNSRLEVIIDEILKQSDPVPIIILQGDHGHRIKDTDGASLSKPVLLNLFANLNAFYLPERSDQSLYASISNVNTFRVILDEYFNAHLGLLPDENYLLLNNIFVGVST